MPRPRFRLVAGSLLISVVALLALAAQALANNPPIPWP